jgi:fido (protein-threonine AMPylation protein)
LQQVDGLVPTKHLLDTADSNIAGKISLDAAERSITDYYEQNPPATEDEKRGEEADKVSVRITRILSGKTFKLSPVELTSIHRRLFAGICDFAGEFRNYNITKKEWVLNGDSVYYGDFHDLRELLDYDFDREKAFDYGRLSPRAAVEHITRFLSGVWQIHPFCEGNTRAIAVFAIQYLRAFGCDVTNDTFEKHSRYFRNALVRANYNNYPQGVKATQGYLDRFFDRLLFGGQDELKNRELRVDLTPPKEV